MGEFNNVEVACKKFGRDETIVLSHPWHDGLLAATYLVIAALTDDREQILLTAGVYSGEKVDGRTVMDTWPEEMIAAFPSPRVGQSIKIALNDSEAAWYNNRDRIESFHRTLAFACMAQDIAGGWNGFHFFEAGRQR